jgi:hypothetical protein
MNISPMNTQRDYRNALKEIEGFMTAKATRPRAIASMYSSRSSKRGSGSIIQWIFSLSDAQNDLATT